MKKVIIIGGGLGGLSAGALLSQWGYDVTLCEQYRLVGGYATTYKRGNTLCEVGLHELDGFHDNDPKKIVWDMLELDKRLKRIPIPQFYHYIGHQKHLTMPHSYDKAITYLIEQFPHEKHGIHQFFTTMKIVYHEALTYEDSPWYKKILAPLFFPTLIRFADKTLLPTLQQWFNDAILIDFLLANVGYYHDDAKELSFLFFTMAQYSYFEGGSWFIQGGSQNLSNALASIIEENGGKVYKRSPVKQILIENNHAIGVEIAYQKKEMMPLRGDIIIANANPFSVYNELLPIEYRDKSLEKYQVAPSLSTLYITFKRSLKEIYGSRPYTVFIQGEDNRSSPVEKRGFCFVDYSQIDSNLTHEGSFGSVVVTDYLHEWESLTDREYATKKSHLATELLKRLEEYYPLLRDNIVILDISTPKTMKRYTSNYQGSVYGFAQTPSQGRHRFSNRSTTLSNLYFSSAWTVPGGGFSGTLLSGLMCAKRIKENS